MKVDVINNIPYLSPSETEVVAGRPDLLRVYPALPAPIIVREKVVAAGELPDDDKDELGELMQDLPKQGGEGSSSSRDQGGDRRTPSDPPAPQPRARDLKEEAKSIRHLMTHLPKNPYCDACQRAKIENGKVLSPGLPPR